MQVAMLAAGRFHDDAPNAELAEPVAEGAAGGQTSRPQMMDGVARVTQRGRQKRLMPPPLGTSAGRIKPQAFAPIGFAGHGATALGQSAHETTGISGQIGDTGKCRG